MVFERFMYTSIVVVCLKILTFTVFFRVFVTRCPLKKCVKVVVYTDWKLKNVGLLDDYLRFFFFFYLNFFPRAKKQFSSQKNCASEWPQSVTFQLGKTLSVRRKNRYFIAGFLLAIFRTLLTENLYTLCGVYILAHVCCSVITFFSDWKFFKTYFAPFICYTF